MPVIISYKEKANTMQGIMIVEDPNNANVHEEYPMPKFIFDLVKANVQDGTLNLSTLWARVLNISKQLP